MKSIVIDERRSQDAEENYFLVECNGSGPNGFIFSFLTFSGIIFLMDAKLSVEFGNVSYFKECNNFIESKTIVEWSYWKELICLNFQ